MEPNATTGTEPEILIELKSSGPQWVELYEDFRRDGLSHAQATDVIDLWLDAILVPADIVVIA